MRVSVLAAVVVAVAGLSGCGGGGEAAAPVVTVTAPAPSPDVAATPTPPPSPSPKAKKIRVPKVVGKNLQYGQDKMQSVGLFNLREEDAEGLQRLMLVDVNWTVVKQSPKAGKRVGEDQVITLYARKWSD